MMDVVHVDISNVARWFFEDNEQEEYDLASDFPSLISPWESAVYIYTFPRYSNNRNRITALPRGVLLRAEISVLELNSDERLQAMSGFVRNLGIEGSIDDGLHWVQRVELYTNSGNFTGGMTLFLDREGQMVTEKIPLVIGPRSMEDKDVVSGVVTSVYYPVAMAISLLHCRNVEVRDRPVSRQQRRMAERKGEAMITYKELVIDAFRKQVRNETHQEGDNEIKRALHICRGHFATYTDANPLFGKHTGMFWRPMHVRGHKEAGEVHKTYKVEANETPGTMQD